MTGIRPFRMHFCDFLQGNIRDAAVDLQIFDSSEAKARPIGIAVGEPELNSWLILWYTAREMLALVTALRKTYESCAKSLLIFGIRSAAFAMRVH